MSFRYGIRSQALEQAGDHIGGYACVLSDRPITQRNAVDRHNPESTFGPVRCDWSPEASAYLWPGFLSRQHPASARHTGRSWRAKCGMFGRRPGRCQVRARPERLSRLLHTVGMIRLGTSADLAGAASVYRRASLSNAGDRDNLLAHPEYLILGPEGLAEGRTHVAEEDGSLVGFATWVETAGTIELEDLFVDPGYMRRGIAAVLVNRIAEVLRERGVERLEVTANPHALGFYRAIGFTDCGVAETEFGAAPRMVLAIS